MAPPFGHVDASAVAQGPQGGADERAGTETHISAANCAVRLTFDGHTGSFGSPSQPPPHLNLAGGETVILLQPALPLAGVSNRDGEGGSAK